MARTLPVILILTIAFLATVHGECLKKKMGECKSGIEFDSDSSPTCGSDGCIYNDDSCAKEVTLLTAKGSSKI